MEDGPISNRGITISSRSDSPGFILIDETKDNYLRQDATAWPRKISDYFHSEQDGVLCYHSFVVRGQQRTTNKGCKVGLGLNVRMNVVNKVVTNSNY